MFTHLHGHDHYSLLEGMGKPKDILAKAKDLGMKAIGLTGYGAMYGMVEFYEGAQKSDIKPIIGLEISLVDDLKIKTAKQAPTNICLLAANYEGYLNLMKISSIGNLDGFFERARTDFETLKAHSEGLIAFIGGDKSIIGNMVIANENPHKIKETVRKIHNIYGIENIYLEIIAQSERLEPNIAKVNKTVQQLAISMGLKLITANNFHYVNKDDKKAYETLLCIRDGLKMYDPNHVSIYGDYHIASEEEITSILEINGFEDSQIKEMIKNIDDIVNKIDLKIPLHQLLFPKYESPEDILDLYSKTKDDLVETKD